MKSVCPGNRGDGVDGCTRADQARGSGSTPTSPLQFRLGETEAARALVLQFHYSARAKDGGTMIGTFHREDRGGLCVAACMFTAPSAPWSERMLDLHRLVRRPRYAVPLSRLVAWTCRAIKAAGKYDLLISYADSTQGHHGGIYQACGWSYHGKRTPIIDGFTTPEGEYIPRRSAQKRLGCNRRHELEARGMVPHWDKGKHLYWRALGPSGVEKAARLGLLSLPYPKPSKLAAFRRRV